MRHATDFQLRGGRKAEMLLAVLSSGDPTDIGDDEIVRLTLDVLASESDFLERDAAYRNALADAQGKKVRRRHSKKSVGELAIKEWAEARKAQLREMMETCGDLPPATASSDELARYVTKVLAWSRKVSK